MVHPILLASDLGCFHCVLSQQAAINILFAHHPQLDFTSHYD